METQLKIIWDGDAAGLAQHRLSLAEFGPALNRMLIAMRRIASGIVTQAQEGGDVGMRGGRLAKLASQLDLEITGVEQGSLGLTMACVLRLAPDQSSEPVSSLADQTCSEFVTAIEHESAGRLRNGMVREYLRALPSGVKSQSYSVCRSDGSIFRAQIGQVTLAQMPAEAPALDEIVAAIMGVSFDPSRPEIRLQDPKSKRAVVCSATPTLIERALALRSAPVRALMVQHAGKLRLLRLCPADAVMDLPGLAAETSSALLWERWDELLRRFAQ
jgi:hypothetical protein